MTPGPDTVLRCPECQSLVRLPTLASGNTLGEVVWSDGRRLAPMLRTTPEVVRCGTCAAPFLLDDADLVGSFNEYRALPPALDQEVTLVECAPSARLKVMGVLRAAPGLTPPAAQEALRSLPFIVLAKARPDDATALRDQLEAAGGRTSLRTVGVPAPVVEPPAEWLAAPFVSDATEADGWALATRFSGQPCEQLVRRFTWWVGNDAFRNGLPWVPLSDRPEARANVERLTSLLPAGPIRGEALRQLRRFAEAISELEPYAGDFFVGPVLDAARAGRDALFVVAIAA